ncbi:MAG: acyl-CoA desaturase [Flavobacteriales bacterium]|nr:acyl-CoA desaturase [Flavobacteriales bacterium]
MKNPKCRMEDQLAFCWKKSIWLYLFLLPSALFIWSAASLKLGVISFTMTFFIVCIGHSVGLHRGIIHKSYNSKRWFRNLTAYLFVQTGLGSPLAWLKLHYTRDYWQNRKDCPGYFQYHHSLITDYFWNLHLHYQPKSLDPFSIPEEDLKDPWLNWLDKTWYLHVLGLNACIWLLFGFEAMIMCGAVRISSTLLGHWFIGYMTHKYGYSHFKVKEADVSGKNNWFLGIVSFGEGYHNNHHAHPQSAKFGLKWFEIDFGWYFILLFKKLGWIKNVKEAGKDRTLKKKATVHKIHWAFPSFRF